MNELEIIFYVIVFIAFLVARILKSRTKTNEEMAEPYAPANRMENEEPKPVRKQRQEDVFGDLIREFQKAQKERQKKIQPVRQKKQAKLQRQVQPLIPQAVERELLQKEGVSAIHLVRERQLSRSEEEIADSEITDVDLATGKHADLDFDPRKAFLLKTLLERKYL